MVTVRSAPRTRWLTQLGLSVCATVTATLLVTGIQHEVAWFRSEPTRVAVDMTSGGKFAARVEALRATPDAPAIAAPPVPLLAADAALKALPVSFAPVPSPQLADIGKSTKRPPKADAHRRPTVEVARDVVPPRRSESVPVADDASRAPLASGDGGENALWATTKGIYRQTVALGGTALDRINPLNLIP